MLVATKSEQVGRHGEMKVSTLTIDNPGMMLSHMFDTIYTNKHKIVVQEIASNCRDAHREMGHPEVPITIKLPNKLDPTLQFIDEGPGLNPQRIDAVYNSVGASTKRGSNDQTGGFGIGSKTPWSLTNMFLVKTTSWEGEGESRELVYREYTMLREGFFFTCNQTGDAEVRDPALYKSGTIVELQLEEKEWSNIESEIQKIFVAWNPKPNIVGYASGDWTWDTNLETLFNGPGWEVYKNSGNQNHWDNRTYIFMDGIPYPLDWNALRSGFNSIMTDVVIPGVGVDGNDIIINSVNDPKTNARIKLLWEQISVLQNVTCGLQFKTGELAPALNRESLQYTPQTVRRIIARMMVATRVIITTYEEKIALAPTYIEALHMWKDLTSNVLRNIISGSRAKWRDIPLNTSLTLHLPKSVSVTKIHIRSQYGRNKYSTREEDSIKLEGVMTEKQIFIDNGYNERNLRHYMETNGFVGYNESNCIYLLKFRKGFSDPSILLPDIDEQVMADQFLNSDMWKGIVHGGLSDQFPKKPINRVSYKQTGGPKKDPLATNQWDSSAEKFMASDVMIPVDVDDPISTDEIIYTLTFRKESKEWSDQALNTFEIALGKFIHGVSERFKHRIPDYWVDVRDKAKDWLEAQPIADLRAEYIRKRDINSLIDGACANINSSMARLIKDEELNKLITAPDWGTLRYLYMVTFNGEQKLDTSEESTKLSRINSVNVFLDKPIKIEDFPESPTTTPEAFQLQELIRKYKFVSHVAASYTLDEITLANIRADLAIFINAKG